tara:strand:- start:128 stop:295 length:168 start_codon:yes stop_codon:yes gene_type:complete
MNYITSNWPELVTAISGIAITARVIVKLTPTPKDDAFLAKVITLLKHIGLHVDPK